MFFWKSNEEEKEERLSLSLMILLALVLPAVLIVSVGRLLLGRDEEETQPKPAEKANRAREKTTRAAEKSFAGTGGKSPEEIKEAAGKKRARQTKGAGRREDDLTRIEGIGPKTVEVLRSHGITTFRQLADTPVERLNEIMGAAGFRMNPPDTWPEQASLAADSKMEELDALQSRLHAGRKTKK
jgi:predicted flap endonuclease-1-like 5' DNA nuclease